MPVQAPQVYFQLTLAPPPRQCPLGRVVPARQQLVHFQKLAAINIFYARLQLRHRRPKFKFVRFGPKDGVIGQTRGRLNCPQVPCMDDARGAREKSDISAKRSGAAMYSAFEAAALAAGPDVNR